MKRAESRLIETFLYHVNQGLITGRADDGAAILHQVADALRAIQSGEHVDKALRITRDVGQPAADRNWTVALILRAHEKAGDKKIVAYTAANNWLEAHGHKRLSDRRLREILKERREEISVVESTQLIIEKTREALDQEQKKAE